MRVLIIEDETAAALNLQSLLRHCFPQMHFEALLESVEDTVRWFNSGGRADLVFMDIHLADGDAFKIFERTRIDCPIIFTTAYDQYALEAFSVNSIDYLLKPIKETDLRRAVDKMSRLSGAEVAGRRTALESVARHRGVQSILIYSGDRIIPLKTDRIAYFYSSGSTTFVSTTDCGRHLIEKTLESIMETLPTDSFFRANRQFIISRESIVDISLWFGSRVAVNLSQPTPEKIIISKVRTPEFKAWLAGAGNP